jgi:hypothetical protein
LKTLIKIAWKKFDQHMMKPYLLKSVDTNNSQYLLTLQSSSQPSSSQSKSTLQLRTNNLYICLGLEHLNKIEWNKFTEPIKLYSSLGVSLSSIRYFFVFKQNLELPYKQTIGEILGHWWIQISPTIIMLYTDGQAANNLNSLSDTEIINAFQQQIQSIYDIDVNVSSILTRTIRAYWPNAFEVLLPEYYQYKDYVNNLLPFTITSLPSPEDQAWMNGHLYNI